MDEIELIKDADARAYTYLENIEGRPVYPSEDKIKALDGLYLSLIHI